jgi:hypothetical protein
MKRHIVAIAIVILVFFCISVQADPSIILSDYSLTPSVLFPGDTAQLQIILTNSETTNTKQTTSVSGGTTTTALHTVAATIQRVWLMPAYDGSKKIQSSQTFTDIGDLAPAASMPLTLQIITDENMSSGWYFPTIAINVEDHQNVRYPIPIKISEQTIDMMPNSIPSKISIGGETQITLTIINNRESTLTNIVVHSNTTNNVSISPSAIAVDSLPASSTQDISFSVKPKQTGNYNLTFSIDYKNGENHHSNTFQFPVEIIQTLDVSTVFYGDTTQIPYQGSSRVRLEVYNAKTSPISAVIVTPINDDVGFSPSQFFIGSMNPDDVFSVSFDIFTGTLPEGNYSMGFKVSFKQGEEYYESPISYKSIQITSAQEKQTATNPIFLGGLLFIAFLAILVLIFFVKKRRNR